VRTVHPCPTGFAYSDFTVNLRMAPGLCLKSRRLKGQSVCVTLSECAVDKNSVRTVDTVQTPDLGVAALELL
jgi:hypothetical protein